MLREKKLSGLSPQANYAGLENRESLYSQKLALTSPTWGGRSVGIVPVG
jgi:hypothetical protein